MLDNDSWFVCFYACVLIYFLEHSLAKAHHTPGNGILCFSVYFQSINACPLQHETYSDKDTCCILYRRVAYSLQSIKPYLSHEKQANVSHCIPCSVSTDNDGFFERWASWSACSTTCGSGFQFRSRINCLKSNSCKEKKECSGPPCNVKGPKKIVWIAGGVGGGIGLLVIIIAIIIICCRRRRRRRLAQSRRFAPPFWTVTTAFTSPPPPLPSRPPPSDKPEELDMRDISLYQPYKLQTHEVNCVRISKMPQFEENTLYYSQ